MPLTSRAAGDSAKVFNRPPKLRVERDAGLKGRHFRQHCVMGFAQRGRICDRLQVRNFRPSDVQLLGRSLEREKRILVCQRRQIVASDSIYRRLRLGDRLLDRRHDKFRGQTRPTDVEVGIEKGIGCHNPKGSAPAGGELSNRIHAARVSPRSL